MNNFAVLDIKQEYPPSSILITITTDVPCHLTCYITDKEPQIHKTSRNQRGLTLLWGVYYCFVAWTPLEQIEWGDTLIHTFLITPWLSCETKWVAFRGTVAGELSPSVSCIFQKHRPFFPYWHILLEPWNTTLVPPPMTPALLEEWTTTFQPPDLFRLINERWDRIEPPYCPFFEPWGTYLTQYNPWLPIPEHDPPELEISNGLLTLTSIDYESRGMRLEFPDSQIKLINDDSYHLIFQARHTNTGGNPNTHSQRYFLFTQNHADSFHIRLIISRGSTWAIYRQNKSVTGMIGTIDYGPEPEALDLHDLWIQLRHMGGFPTDPTGWTLQYIRLELLQEPIGGTITLTNDWLGLFY
ncbi:hypothetical protein ES703_95490 [subsurface metagenome]